jgi:hypothetical protein
MSVKLVDSPKRKSKRLSSITRDTDYSPYITYDFSPSYYDEYAPSTNLSRYVIGKTTSDYSPSVSRSYYSDYAPSTNLSTSLVSKYAPNTDYQTYYRNAPYTKEVIVYDPMFVSRFRPQPLLVSNYDMINSYFRYVIDLLRVLR